MLSFDSFMIPRDSKENDINSSPKDGCYIYGLFLDGARWDEEKGCLNESFANILLDAAPYILLLPTESRKNYENDPTVKFFEATISYRSMNVQFIKLLEEQAFDQFSDSRRTL